MDPYCAARHLLVMGLAFESGLSAAVTQNHRLNIAALLCAVVAIVLTRQYGVPS